MNIISKILTFILLIFISFSINSCDLCTGITNEGGNADESIYYTALPLNSESPNIYNSEITISNVKNLVTNGISYVSPSANGKLCFIRKNHSDGLNSIILSDYDGGNPKIVITDNAIFKLSYPIISPDGNYICFNAGSSRLFFCDTKALTVFNQISSRSQTGFIPSFSPDSRFLAFIEGDGINGYTIKVLDTKNADEVNIVYSRSLGNEIFSNDKDYRINWSFDSKSIIFTIRRQAEDLVYITNIVNSTDRILEIQNNEIGGNNATLSPNGDYLAIAGNDGNIWVVLITSTEMRFSKITNADGFETNFNPQWSRKGDKILYNSRSAFDVDLYSTLLCSELKYNALLVTNFKTYIISNNVYTANWSI